MRARRRTRERARRLVISQTPASPGLTRVATYRRDVHASLVRVWENVYDWEHLPWLHAESFSRIELEDSGPWGWRARIGLQPQDSGNEIRLELVTERAESRYVSRTLAGTGEGAEIWTHLEPVADDETRIEVEFWLPGVRAESAQALGEGFVHLYTRLWDEDEAMMRGREERLRARGRSGRSNRSNEGEPLSLGSLESLRARLPVSVDVGGRPFRIVEVDGELVAHSAICPHLLGPLACSPITGGRLRCPWHGYEYDVRTGQSTDGRGLWLEAAPHLEIDEQTGEVRLRAAD